MAYATRQDIEARYGSGELTIAADRDGDGEVDEMALERALEDASGFIDAYLSKRYQVPFQRPPDIVVHLCATIALYYLSPSAGPLTEEKRKRFEDAEKLLARLASGEIDLGQPRVTSSDVVVVQSSRRLFTRKTMQGLV